MISRISFISNILVSLCVTLVFTVIFIDFLLYGQKNKVKKERKSIVETGTMTLFFAVYYTVARWGFGKLPFSQGVVDIMMVLGWLPLVAGCIINVYGRIVLGGNWGNHIKIYESHTLTRRGPYKYVRHPLYSSIILMLLSGSLLYHDLLLLVMTCVIFIPMMVYRANQEEVMLMAQFSDYSAYKEEVGQLAPRIRKKRKKQ